MVTTLLVSTALVTWAVALASLLLLATLGVLGAAVDGANRIRGALRVTIWGALAMAATAGIGACFGTRV